MSRRILGLLLAGSLFLAGCQAGRPEPPPGGVLVWFGEQVVAAEVAVTPEERREGLMHREHLDPDAGMLFLFEGPTEVGFWMRNTLIPLSIAYMVRLREGGYRVVAIRDMDPCLQEPCPTYDPGRPYEAALEVNRGWFAERGIVPGAEARVEGPLESP